MVVCRVGGSVGSVGGGWVGQSHNNNTTTTTINNNNTTRVGGGWRVRVLRVLEGVGVEGGDSVAADEDRFFSQSCMWGCAMCFASCFAVPLRACRTYRTVPYLAHHHTAAHIAQITNHKSQLES